LAVVFEFDPEKSAANLAKHGIDFDAAQALWQDARLLELGVVWYGAEERRLYVGDIGGRRWTAVITFRRGAIRLISVRRARRSEEMAYDDG
jgi:uncharacterized protein